MAGEMSSVGGQCLATELFQIKFRVRAVLVLNFLLPSLRLFLLNVILRNKSRASHMVWELPEEKV